MTNQNYFEFPAGKYHVFLAILANGGNPNPEPTDNSKPRILSSGHGVISSVCLGHHFRKEINMLGYKTLDNLTQPSLEQELIFNDKFNNIISPYFQKTGKGKGVSVSQNYNELLKSVQGLLCGEYIDARLLGFVLPISKEALKLRYPNATTGLNLHMRGVLHMPDAVTRDILHYEALNITKSYNATMPAGDSGMSSDRMGGTFYRVYDALYCTCFSINFEQAQKNGVTMKDIMILRRALAHLFSSDTSSSRPSGSMMTIYMVEKYEVGQYTPEMRVKKEIEDMMLPIASNPDGIPTTNDYLSKPLFPTELMDGSLDSFPEANTGYHVVKLL